MYEKKMHSTYLHRKKIDFECDLAQMFDENRKGEIHLKESYYIEKCL